MPKKLDKRSGLSVKIKKSEKKSSRDIPAIATDDSRLKNLLD